LSGLFAQIEAFFFTLILGILAGLIFHYYQLTIRTARIGKYSLYVLDFILWIFMIFLVFIAMLIINQGEMRIYVLIALLTGILIYYRNFSPRLEPLLYKGSQSTIAILSTVAKNIIRPIIWLLNRVKTVIDKIKEKPDDGDNR